MLFDAVVIGLGYVGLPLAQCASARGLKVCGLDSSQTVVDGLNTGVSHIGDVTANEVSELLSLGFRATTDSAVLADAAVIVICVPTPLSEAGGPDLTAVDSAVDAIAESLRPGQTVILESTTYPGTTTDRVRPRLEEATGLVVGVDFFLAFSPERVDPGRTDYGVANTPKVVGGVTVACTEKAAQFYGRFIDRVVLAKGSKEAELAKLLENTYRHVNIALVNEMAQFCNELDIDLWDAISCASSKPFGFQPFYPGPGVGGHCIPIDPNYLANDVKTRLGYPFRFVELAQEINSRMPAYVVQRIQDMLNRARKSVYGSSVLLLGVTYKANIADQRESPVREIAVCLEKLGALVSYCDPHVPQWSALRQPLKSVPLDTVSAATSRADLTVLLQQHREFDLDALASVAKLFLDTRGVVEGANVERL